MKTDYQFFSWYPGGNRIMAQIPGAHLEIPSTSAKFYQHLKQLFSIHTVICFFNIQKYC